MSLLKDPEMKDIVADFCNESDKIYEQLIDLLEDYEDDPQQKTLEEFGQVIDRVMGAAKSIEAHLTGQYCELGKSISYKASQSMDQELLTIVVAVLFDTVEILQSVSVNIRQNQEEKVENFNLERFGSRLRWLSEKFQHIQRASVAIEPTELKDQKSIDDLLTELGL